MKSLWTNKEASKYKSSALNMRVYTSRLLGRESNLVLHGGGNTSVKAKKKNIFGELEELIYVKGSGWDLETIEAAGFAPVKMEMLLKLAELDNLTDGEMVRMQRSAMTDPSAPSPSVEAILHAIIPFKYVDHTHADAVVTITNTAKGKERIKKLYGDNMLIVPYVMPGFILAKKIHEMTKNLDWSKCEGMILLNHGVFTFDNDARASYEKMINIVSISQNYLKKHAGKKGYKESKALEDLPKLAAVRKLVSGIKGNPVLVKLDSDKFSVGFSNIAKVSTISGRGPLTPDHIIRTKRNPLVIGKNPSKDLAKYVNGYMEYFKRNDDGRMQCLNPAPNFAIWPGHGMLSFGDDLKAVGIISDIKDHTIKAIQTAEELGGWKVCSEQNLFEIEYWELEQAKLGKGGAKPALHGKIALVTGAASGIGFACVQELRAQGAVVAALDISKKVSTLFDDRNIHSVVCDVTNSKSLKNAIEHTVRRFGGLDILISNAGVFTDSANIQDISDTDWNKSLSLNLTSHKNLLKESIVYLMEGIDSSVVIIASKNVPAPGPGAASYSVAKAGLTQFARVAALELGSSNIRVNIIHPNAVYDTKVWTEEVLSKRAKHYGINVEEYKTNNLLKTDVSSSDVANMACAMAGNVFGKTTGSQVPVDGGNERVV